MRSDYFDLVQKLKEEGLSWKAIEKFFNKKFGTELTPKAIKSRYFREMEKREEVIDGDIVNKALRIIKRGPIKISELGHQLGLDLDEVDELISNLISTRAAVNFQNNYIVFDKRYVKEDNKTINLNNMIKEGEWVSFGVYSDNHSCSMHEMPGTLREFYKICEDKEVSAFFNAGDVSSGGGKVYKGQENELKIIGADNQRKYMIETLPDSDIPTYLISGNHDLDYYNIAGIDIIEDMCKEKKNYYYLGKMGGNVVIDGVDFRLAHGEGGATFAYSYKPQKMIDSYEETNNKPHVLIMGHLHIMLHLPFYKNVIAVLPGCFESKSLYLKKKGLNPETGGAIINMKTAEIEGKTKIINHNVEFIRMGGE